MKFESLLMLLLPVAVPAAGSADDDWKKLADYFENHPRSAPGQVRDAAYYQERAQRHFAWADAVAKFVAAHPADPRRWQAVGDLVWWGALSIEDVVDDGTTVSGKRAIYNNEAGERLARILRPLTERMRADPDLPAEQRERIDFGWISTSYVRMSSTGAATELEARDLRAQLDAFEARFPASDLIRGAEEVYGTICVRPAGDAAFEAHWRKLAASSPSAPARAFAQAKIGLIEAMRRPMDLAFTAIDGRKVDLAALRGQVVLIDFWGTRCKPCIAELPNLKEIYRLHHARGFEIVGIALQQPNSLPELEAFVQKNEMPWPQYYDQMSGKSELRTRFGVTAIPAVFLLDQSGRVVSTNAKGETLEKEVRRLLKL